MSRLQHRDEHAFRTRAAERWGEVPDWVEELATLADMHGLKGAAQKIDRASSTVSQIISKTYRGDLPGIEERVRGALMGSVVDCPILGQIGRDRCLTEQVEPFRSTSAMRAQLYHACRGGCPHSRHTPAQTKGNSND
ncbi:hypothetical protein FP2506_11557 [Fulvimarina pelagi HTCC2506]|uniref:Transcriptional regulator n=1 Tax=Fulvimarina pelagi HTCC2506 TaxID=314231 RepID=Q0FYW8_9HYPH|nr:hypothetical protein [Fulvimarina pelagi]EAU40190.1 hypothetical protein FP2506_11557 [Fulvimarina pelagi HTCC2506]